jgi:hypothetical protein
MQTFIISVNGQKIQYAFEPHSFIMLKDKITRTDFL